jgi:quinol monooxygenase YgiN
MTLILINDWREVKAGAYREAVLVVTRYRVPPLDAEEFRQQAGAALAVLTARPGCLEGSVGRSIDEPELWVMSTRWQTVGVYRRALSNPEVKQRAVPLMYRCVDEPTAFEDLITWNPQAGLAEHESDLITD